MSGPPQTLAPTKFQEGMMDPHINETVTHVAEVDEEAIRRENRPMKIAALFNCIIGFIMPLFWIMACLMYFITKHYEKKAIRDTQVYLTEHTLVCVFANRPIESSRLTIPLSNIASAIVQPRVITVNIKPTAPAVMLNQYYRSDNSTVATSVATRTVPIYYVKNAEVFAELIKSNLD